MHQPLCIDYPNVTSGIRKLSAITYIKWINMIPHCHLKYSYRKTYIMCSQIWTFNPTRQNFKGWRFNSSQQDREGETPYDPTILTKLVIHQDRANSRTRERKREIEHIATGTNHQPRGWTTPSSSWWPSWWWRRPPEMIPPSGKVPERV